MAKTEQEQQQPFDIWAPCPECGAQYERSIPPDAVHHPKRRLGAYGALLVHYERDHPDADPPPGRPAVDE